MVYVVAGILGFSWSIYAYKKQVSLGYQMLISFTIGVAVAAIADTMGL